MRATKLAFEKRYSDDSGIKWAVRLDGEEIEFEAVNTISMPVGEIDWLISALTRIKDEIYGCMIPTIQPPPTIYYMRDNHTFLPLSLDVEQAITQILEAWVEGYRNGMLCSKSVGMPPDVHANGKYRWDEFLAAVRAYYAAIPTYTQQGE